MGIVHPLKEGTKVRKTASSRMEEGERRIVHDQP